MNASQFQKLSTDLRSLARIIPLHWGAVQNNRFDSNINMFEIDSFEQLEAAIRNLSPELQNYFRRRWYLWKCAQCDEYLFNLNPNVEPNPNPSACHTQWSTGSLQAGVCSRCRHRGTCGAHSYLHLRAVSHKRSTY